MNQVVRCGSKSGCGTELLRVAPGGYPPGAPTEHRRAELPQRVRQARLAALARASGPVQFIGRACWTWFAGLGVPPCNAPPIRRLGSPFPPVAPVAATCSRGPAVRHLPRCRVGGGALSRWPPSAAQTGRAGFPHPAFTRARLRAAREGIRPTRLTSPNSPRSRAAGRVLHPVHRHRL